MRVRSSSLKIDPRLRATLDECCDSVLLRTPTKIKEHEPSIAFVSLYRSRLFLLRGAVWPTRSRKKKKEIGILIYWLSTKTELPKSLFSMLGLRR